MKTTFIHVAILKVAACPEFLQLPLRNGVLLSGVLTRDPPKARIWKVSDVWKSCKLCKQIHKMLI